MEALPPGSSHAEVSQGPGRVVAVHRGWAGRGSVGMAPVGSLLEGTALEGNHPVDRGWDHGDTLADHRERAGKGSVGMGLQGREPEHREA